MNQRTCPGSDAKRFARLCAVPTVTLFLLSCGQEERTNPLDPQGAGPSAGPFQVRADASDRGIHLHWQRPDVAEVRRFRVYRRDAATRAQFEAVTSVDSTGYLDLYRDPAVMRGHRYDYQVRAMDNAGRESAEATAGHTSANALPQISIAAGHASTQTRVVPLAITAFGATKMRLSNSADLSSAAWTDFAASVDPWTLPGGDGRKSVYLRVAYDTADTSVVVSDSIDPADITGLAIEVAGGSTRVCTGPTVVRISGTGATEVRLANSEAALANAAWTGFVAPHERADWQLEAGLGGRTVWAELRNDFKAKTGSNVVEVVGAPGTPGEPETVGGCGLIALSWSAVSGATGYRVYRDDGTSPIATVTGGSVVSWDDTSPGANPHTYRVSGVVSTNPAECQEGEKSTATSSATALATPGAPTGVTATAGCGSISVRWSAVSGTTAYRVYRDNEMTYHEAPAPTTSWVDASPGSSARRYAVVAVASNCVGGRSAQTTPITRLDCPSGWAYAPAGTFTMGSPSSESCRDSDEGQHTDPSRSPWTLVGISSRSPDDTSNGLLEG